MHEHRDERPGLKPGRYWLIPLAALAICAIASVLIVTRWGAFVSDDSYEYIKPVRDAMAGLGFEPSPIFPPGLPLALLALGWLDLDPLISVRWLNALLFGANVLLAGAIVRRMGAAKGAALLAALWVAWSEPSLDAHAWAMSEAMCITFTLAAMYLLLAYRDSPRWPLLIACALAVAAACLTRYAALPIVAAISLALLLFHPAPRWKDRVIAVVAFAGIALLPVVAYLLRSAVVLGRPLYYPAYGSVPFTRDNLTWYLYNTLDWFVPGRFLRGHELTAGLGALLVLGMVCAAWWLASRRQPSAPLRRSPGLWLLAAYVLTSYLLLYLARGLTFLAVYNPRYLVPPLLVALLAIAYLVDRFWRLSGHWSRAAIAALCLSFSLYYGYRAADYTWRTSQTGLGYLNVGWHESQTIPYLKQDLDRAMVATGDVGIYFWTGTLPRVVTDFASPEAMRAYLCESRAILVIMSQMPPEIYGLDEASVVSGLELEREFNDGKVYRCPPSP